MFPWLLKLYLDVWCSCIVYLSLPTRSDLEGLISVVSIGVSLVAEALLDCPVLLLCQGKIESFLIFATACSIYMRKFIRYIYFYCMNRWWNILHLYDRYWILLFLPQQTITTTIINKKMIGPGHYSYNIFSIIVCLGKLEHCYFYGYWVNQRRNEALITSDF